MDPLLELAFSIKAAQRELERRANEVLKPLGLTGAQADALTVLAQAGPISLKELGELLIAEAGHPSRLVDRVVAAGLVERRPADDDRRRIVLTLTPRGKEVEGKAAEARQGILDFARGLLGGRDVEPTLGLFREMLQHSAYAELLERRRALADRSLAAAPRPDSVPRSTRRGRPLTGPASTMETKR